MFKKIHIGSNGTPRCSRRMSARRVGGVRPAMTVSEEAFRRLEPATQCMRCASYVKEATDQQQPIAAGRAPNGDTP